MTLHGLQIPATLTALIAEGRWPKVSTEALSQNLRSWIPAERIKRFAPDEDRIYLYSPPFGTIADNINNKNDKFWTRFGALNEISPARTLMIADFGLGADAPIVLHYIDHGDQPSVLRLAWPSDGADRRSTRWVQIAETFDTFALILGLTAIQQ